MTTSQCASTTRIVVEISPLLGNISVARVAMSCPSCCRGFDLCYQTYCFQKTYELLRNTNKTRMPPGQHMDDYLTQFRSGMWRLNYRLSPEGRTRFFQEFLPLLHDTMHTTLGDREAEAWYLVYIGTRVCGRGKGHARKLIEHVTKVADRESRATYLESSNPVNVPIYRKFGFEATRQINLQRGGRNIPLDIMVREPKK